MRKIVSVASVLPIAPSGQPDGFAFVPHTVANGAHADMVTREKRGSGSNPPRLVGFDPNQTSD